MKLHPHTTLRSRLEGFLSEDSAPYQDDFDRGYEKGINRAIDELEGTSPYRPWQIIGGACLAGAFALLICGHYPVATTSPWSAGSCCSGSAVQIYLR